MAIKVGDKAIPNRVQPSFKPAVLPPPPKIADYVPTGEPTNLDQWMAKYKGYVALANANIKRAQAAKALYKGNAAKVKFYDDQIAQFNKEIGNWNTQIASTQNKIWESTGQYENLLKGTERDAFMAINSLFKNYNLESLAGKIYDYVKNGYSADTISILLQDTKEYKERFAGNEARKAAGLPVLSPGEYLATESAYRQIMSSAGLPIGFYDQNSDFNDWIGKNLSPTEIQTRVDMATQATILANPSYRAALNQLGISDSELTAYWLDSARALPHLQKSAATAQIGAQALRQGLSFDTQYAGQLATEGVTGEQAAQGYGVIAGELGTLGNLGDIYGQDWDQRTAEEAILRGNSGAINKRAGLISQERANFSGAAGAARGGLAGKGGAR